jgi:multidrug transporter EmrE-like cation transporter
MSPLYLALAVVFNVIANLLFKQASGISGWTFQKVGMYGVGLAIGLANTLCYIKALEQYALSVAFPIFMTGSAILIAVMSLIIFSEGISLQKAAGFCALGVGLALLWKS